MTTRSRFQKANWIRRERRYELYRRDNFHCLYCEADLTHARTEQRTLDHLLPLSHGGGSHNSNLVTSCVPCNTRRGSMAWKDYARWYGTPGAISRIKAAVKISREQEQAMVVSEPTEKPRCPGCGTEDPPVFDPERGPMMLAGVIPWPEDKPLPPPSYPGSRPKRTGKDVCPACGHESGPRLYG